LYEKINYPTKTNSHDKNIKILQQILINTNAKFTVLSILNNNKDCEAALNKALMFNAAKLVTKYFVPVIITVQNLPRSRI
jgi:hypothetical protein